MTLSEYLRLAAIVFVVALFPAGFVTGCIDEKERFDAYKALVSAAGKNQEDKTAARIVSDRQTKERTDRDYKARISRLDGDLADSRTKLQQYASLSIVPAVPAHSTGSGAGEVNSGLVCFSRDRLSEGFRASLQRAGERFAGLAQRGSGGIAGFEACATWALEEAAKPR